MNLTRRTIQVSYHVLIMSHSYFILVFPVSGLKTLFSINSFCLLASFIATKVFKNLITKQRTSWRAKEFRKYCSAECFETERCFYFVSDIPSSSSLWHCHCNTKDFITHYSFSFYSAFDVYLCNCNVPHIF